jgi:hypothetical protein
MMFPVGVRTDREPLLMHPPPDRGFSPGAVARAFSLVRASSGLHPSARAPTVAAWKKSRAGKPPPGGQGNYPQESGGLAESPGPGARRLAWRCPHGRWSSLSSSRGGEGGLLGGPTCISSAEAL